MPKEGSRGGLETMCLSVVQESGKRVELAARECRVGCLHYGLRLRQGFHWKALRHLVLPRHLGECLERWTLALPRWTLKLERRWLGFLGPEFEGLIQGHPSLAG